MKSSAEVLKTLRGHKRRPAARERRQRAASMTLRDYITALRPTAQTLSEAVCAIDLAGSIQFANTHFQRMLARSETELLGKSVWDFGQCVSIHPPNELMSSAQNQVLLDALIQRASQEYSACEWRRPDGSPAPCLCSLRPIIHDGQTLGVMLVSRETDDRALSGAQAPALHDGYAESHAETVRQALRETAQVERRLRVVETVGDIALAQLPLDGLLQALLDGIRREMALENVGIFLVNEAGVMVTARVASGAGAEIADSIHVPFGQGIIGEAMRARRPIFIPNARELVARSEHFTPELRARMNLQSLLVVPLIVDGRPIGAISVGASEPDLFTQEDVRLVELVGERAALAIERARAHDEATRAHERLRFLNDASGSLNATLDYHEATRRLADVVTPALADACAIYLLEDDGLLRKVATRLPALGLAADPQTAALERLIAGLASTVEVRSDDPTCAVGRAVHSLTAVVERTRLTDDTGAAALMSNCLSVPLVVRQHALGAVYLVGRPGREFSTGDMTLIQGLAERAAVAIDNARFYLETQQALAAGSAMATQLDTIFDATDVGIVVTGLHGEYLRINAYGANMLGLAHAPIARVPDQARPPFELRTPEGDVIPPEREPLYLARVLGRPVEQRVVIHRRDTGKDIQALIRCSPWLDVRQHIAGAIGVFTDITAISALERQKDEFLGIASHELKTPLTSLKILAQLLARKMETSGESRDLEQAKRMQISIKRMESLIRDLLDVSLIHEGKLALNQTLTELGAICADAVSEQKLLTQRNIHYSAASDEPLMVYADTERIYQVVTNLLSNALKYSPATEPVEVHTRATASEYIVSVQDYGPGVPPEAIDHIFERFFRVPGMQVQTGSGVGLGLGLNLSKDIVSRHGGRIWVESKLGHGSVFSFALPRAESAPEA